MAIGDRQLGGILGDETVAWVGAADMRAQRTFLTGWIVDAIGEIIGGALCRIAFGR